MREQRIVDDVIVAKIVSKQKIEKPENRNVVSAVDGSLGVWHGWAWTP
jgi:hypothetical protein